MSKFKFNSKKNKFNFIKDSDDILNTEMIKSTRTEIFSNKKIIIENCKNIIDYQEDYIKLSLKKSYMNIVGTNFKIVSFDEKRIEINGNILSVEFCI